MTVQFHFAFYLPHFYRPIVYSDCAIHALYQSYELKKLTLAKYYLILVNKLKNFCHKHSEINCEKQNNK